MSVVDKLKALSMELRKARSSIAPSIVFALSEIDKVGKNAGNRATTEDEAIKAVQKIVTVMESNLNLTTDPSKIDNLNLEISTLKSVLPPVTSEDDVRAFLNALALDESFDMSEKALKGNLMKALRTKFGAAIDMKRAGELVSEIYKV